MGQRHSRASRNNELFLRLGFRLPPSPDALFERLQRESELMNKYEEEIIEMVKDIDDLTPPEKARLAEQVLPLIDKTQECLNKTMGGEFGWFCQDDQEHIFEEWLRGDLSDPLPEACIALCKCTRDNYKEQFEFRTEDLKKARKLLESFREYD
ncbi:hypothetical protein BCR34DRAFT_582325 [Clohesyomyces aquaticus]|uniref:Uncharacterized protein n=1 Tax=Clohesyomyces aquaticus TaxID=1231657 RepID=A0A1Y2A9Z2_9PLEO|nr:hypothetical protein BCR34DRAFT_582325 [Clohesyomyces aquaticus]